MSQEPSNPSGTLTFLIADVRGYTAYTHAHGDQAGAERRMIVAGFGPSAQDYSWAR
jgi:hypothetical protein